VVQLRVRSAGGALGPVQDLSPRGENNSFPQLAVNANGDAAFAWGHGDMGSLQGRIRLSGGALGAIQLIAGPGAGFGRDYDVGLDPNANATFVWRNRETAVIECGRENCYRLRTRVLSSGGTLGTIATLSASGVHAQSPQVGVDQNGNATFVWLRYGADAIACLIYHSDSCSVQTRVRAANGTLSALRTISGPGAIEPQVAVDSNGNATFVWTSRPDTSTCCYRIRTRTRSASGALSAIQTLSASGQDAFAPQVAVNENGNATFVWLRYDGTSDCHRGGPCLRVQTRTRTVAAALSAVQTLSAAKSNSEYPRVGIDGNANAVFVWRSRDLKAIRARSRSATGALSATQTISDPAQPSVVRSIVINPLALAVNPAGNAVAGWTSFDGLNHRIEGAIGP
jgi:hypothetical protein